MTKQFSSWIASNTLIFKVLRSLNKTKSAWIDFLQLFHDRQHRVEEIKKAMTPPESKDVLSVESFGKNCPGKYHFFQGLTLDKQHI